MRSLIKRLLAGTTATSLALAPMPGRANPLGGQVVGGAATIQGQGTGAVTVNQSSNRAIIDWRTFNIAPNETTQFVQPGATSVTLNRVTGGLGLSTIDGTIKANGGVYIVNPDGILFGPTAKVNVGSFLGTTHDIADGDFMAGRNAFTISGNPSASIVNQGTITAAKGGFAALVAPGVRNDGVIAANLGTVALASGNAFTLDLYGDSLIKLQPGDAIMGTVRDAATGQTLQSLVSNTGTLKANGGKVMLTAVTAKQVVDSVINSSGVIEANTVGTRKGLVVFGADTADTKPTGAPIQTVKVSGRIKTAGRKAGTVGGKIQITGENIQLTRAKLDASGKAGGGTILVGGDFKGGDPTAPAVTFLGQSFESTAVPNATFVSVDARTTLDASAKASGNGGKIVVWSDTDTSFAGSISASGGKSGGNGGFAEVSGKQSVNFTGIKANLTAPKGQSGTILFDPDVENIDQIAANTLSDLLNGTSGSKNGDGHISTAFGAVVVAADTINVLPGVDILKTAGGDATLALFATAGISIGANVVIGSSMGRLSLYMDADSQNSVLFPTAGSALLAANSNYPYLIDIEGSISNAVLQGGTITDLNGASILALFQAEAQSYFGQYFQAQFISYALPALQSATVTIDPSARFYLNGGTYTAYGNDYYIIGGPNFVSQMGQMVNLYTVAAQARPQFGSQLPPVVDCEFPCGVAIQSQFVPTGDFNSDGTPGGQYVTQALSYSVIRNQSFTPAGVLSNDPIPGFTVPSTPLVGSGIKKYTFSELVKLAADESITPLEAFQWESSLNGNSLDTKAFTAFDASGAMSSLDGLMSGIEAAHPDLVGPVSSVYGFFSKVPGISRWTDPVEKILKISNFSVDDQIELSLAIKYRPGALIVSMLAALMSGVLDEAAGSVFSGAQLSAYIMKHLGDNPTAAEVQQQIATLQSKVTNIITGKTNELRTAIFNNIKH